MQESDYLDRKAHVLQLQKKNHEEDLKELQRCQREYDIECLRTKIKNTAEEYNLFRQTPYIAGDKFNFYREYLLEQIQINIGELQKIVEEKNE